MATITVGIGGDVQAALNAAVGGDEIVIAHAGSWVGNYTVPVHSGASYVTVKTDGTLSPVGTTVTPADAAQMPTFSSPNISPAFEWAPGADYWKFTGIEVGPGGHVDHIGLQIGTHEDPVLANYPVNIILDRCYIHGDPVSGMMKRGISIHVVNGHVIDCCVQDVVSAGSDSQAVWINGPGPYLIDNNDLQAAGMSILVGGADPAVTNMVPTDLTITNNALTKPNSWFLSNDWQVKNAFELKNARQVVFEHNTINRVWADAQTGYAILLTPRNQDNTAPWTVVEDITIRYNEILNVNCGISILGDDDEHSSQRTNDIDIHDNLIVTDTAYENPSDPGAGGRAFLIDRGPTAVVIDHNTIINDGAMMMPLADPTYIPPSFVFTNNIWAHGTYGIKGDALLQGTASLDGYFSGYTVTGNVVGGGDATEYPTPNTFLSVPDWEAIFTDFAGGDYSLAALSPYTGKGADFSLLPSGGSGAAMTFYLYGTDGIVDPPTTWKGGWDQTPGSGNATIAMDPLKNFGANVARVASEASASNPFKAAIIRSVSRPVAAQTISGTLDAIIGIQESNADADFYWKVYAYVRVGVTDAVRGVLLDWEDATAEWPTTSTGTGFPSPQALSSVVALAGDQIVVEIGFIARNAHTNSRTGTIRIGAMTTAAHFPELPDLTLGSTATTTSAPSLIFSNPITLLETENDFYANATVLTGSLVESVDMTPATRDGDEPTPCAGAADTTTARYNSVWYQWLCPEDQSATVEAVITGGLFTFNTCLMVLTGAPGSFVTVDCSAENDPTTETITFNATGGVLYTFMVSTIYTGGGQLVFSFTPAVEPAADEVVIGNGVEDVMDGADLTAMAWLYLKATNAGIRHFYYIGNGETPFTDLDPYVWVGTDTDGVTLRMDLYDGSSITTYLGPVLALTTWYHWALVKSDDDFAVYLSTEGDAPMAAPVITASRAIGLVPLQQFVYGLEGVTIPKAYKTWNTNLLSDEIRDERESYAVEHKSEIVNVTQFKTDTRNSVGGWTDYSGYDRRIGPPEAGSPTDGWEIIEGPELTIQPERAFEDNFDSYTAGFESGGYFPGVVDQAAYYEYPTQPILHTYIAAGIGLNGSQAYYNRGFGGADLWFEHDDYEGRCGSVGAYSYKVPGIVPGNPTSGAGVGIQILNPIQFADNPDFLFGIANGETSGANGDLFFFNVYDGTEETIPNVYHDLTWERVILWFQLSTVAGGQTDVNANGRVWVTIDGVLVYQKTGLKLTVDSRRWTDDINTWDATSFHWGGYMDSVTVNTGCFDEACPGTRGAARTGV